MTLTRVAVRFLNSLAISSLVLSSGGGTPIMLGVVGLWIPAAGARLEWQRRGSDGSTCQAGGV